MSYPWAGKIRWRRKWQSTHSSTLAWKIPWAEEPGVLQSMGSQRVRHDFAFHFSRNRMWLIATILDSADTHASIITESSVAEVCSTLWSKK